VNNSFAVGGSECVRNLSPPFKNLLKRQRPSGNVMLQRGAFHKLHGNKRLAILLANLVDRANVGVIQRGSCTRLSTKPFQYLRIVGQVVGNKLERDEPMKGRILGLVHDAHAAPTQHLDDSVMRNDLADHWAEGGRPIGNKLVWLQASLLVIRQIVDIGEWNDQQTCVSLIGLQKLFEVSL
jgi:hypothetical protein